MVEVDALRQQAKDAEKRSYWAAAAECYKELLLKSGEFWDRFFYVQALILSGQLKSAETHLKTLQEADEGHAGDIGMLAATLSEQAGLPGTAELWIRARDLGASEYWTLYGEARERLRRGELSHARELTERYVAHADAENAGLRFAANLYFRAGDLQAAEHMLAKCQASASDRIEIVLESAPGMTYYPERIALYNAARQMNVPGHFVDLGAFLGSLTLPMLRGLQDNEFAKRNGARVYAYDRFRWFPKMDEQWRDSFPGCKPEPHESFRHVYDFVVKTWSGHLGLTDEFLQKRLTVAEADLEVYRWTEGDISLLSVDAMKVPAIACSIVSEFMTRLVPGALCFHQDFGVETNWFIHIHQYLLKDSFEIADHVPAMSGVMSGIMFRLVEPVSEADAERVRSHDLWDTKTADAAFTYWLDHVHPQDRPTIAAIHAFYRQEIAPHRGRLPKA